MSPKHYSLKNAWMLIAFWTLLISGSATCGVLYYLHQRELQTQDAHFNISMITQMGEDRGTLPTSYFAELLGLSSDKKVNLIAYNVDEAEQLLLKSPLIKTVKVGKIKPNSLSIEYSVRKPYFRLFGEKNRAIDREGVSIPLHPFFKEEGLPELLLGEKTLSKGDVLLQQIRRILGIMDFNGLILTCMDISQIDEPSLGKRQIVLTLLERRNPTKSWMLRLSPENTDAQIKNFFFLRESPQMCELKEGCLRVDLRVLPLALFN